MKTKVKQIKWTSFGIVLAIVLSIITGIFTSVIGIIKIQNYNHPYWFGLVFGGIGALFGIWISKRLKPWIAVNQRLRNDYYLPVVYLTVGFFGLFLMAGSFINQSLSNVDTCDDFVVINKYRQESRFRQPEINSLVVKIYERPQRIICSRNYWFRTSKGQSVSLCLHKSKLGFDFISLTNDK
jgi:hypothetical protein